MVRLFCMSTLYPGRDGYLQTIDTGDLPGQVGRARLSFAAIGRMDGTDNPRLIAALHLLNRKPETF